MIRPVALILVKRSIIDFLLAFTSARLANLEFVIVDSGLLFHPQSHITAAAAGKFSPNVMQPNWWQALDFARLNHSTISFFNFLKPETVTLRWNHVRLNASKENDNVMWI